MKNKKLKAFTLIELVVVILITSITMAVGISFYESIKVTSRHKLIVSEIDRFNGIFENLRTTDLFLEQYDSVDGYNTINTMNKDEIVDLFYSVYVIKPVLVNKYDNPLTPLELTDIGNTDNDEKDITIGLQKCKFLFDTQGKTINSQNHKKLCETPYIGDGLINIQGFLLSNSAVINIERDNYYFNNNNYFGNIFTISEGENLLLDKGEKQTELTSGTYHYYDLLSDSFQDFFNGGFFVYQMKKLNGDIEKGIFVGTELDFTNIIRNEYIPGVINNVVLDSTDLVSDLEDRKNMTIGQFSDVQFLYNDPLDFSNGYKELLFFGIQNYE